jgi:predicted DNA-binding ribbon-helix-helix protein
MMDSVTHAGALPREDEPSPNSTRPAGLINRNITVHGRRTSIRLEHSMWEALRELSGRERMTMSELCSRIAASKDAALTLTAALRVFIVDYFRGAATEEGHALAGHGRPRARSSRRLTVILHGDRTRASAA